MKNDDLNVIWTEIEVQNNQQDHLLQRMVYVDLLYRAFIGSIGLPSKRFLSIEIPKDDAYKFDSFTVPCGFTLSLNTPCIKHEGYIACVLQSSSSNQNDVFAIVAKDILDELRKQKEANKYVDTLKTRIEKWRDFFRNPEKNRLSDKAVIGLFGELTLIKDLCSCGIGIVSDLWNGPIKAAQDFQGAGMAIEVKTTASNSLEYVHISSEAQLDSTGYEVLFLVGYRLVINEAAGSSLPMLIKQVSQLLSGQQLSRFNAKLTCLGYTEEDDAFYNKKYSIKECLVYQVKDNFPRLCNSDIPRGIDDVGYRLSIKSCEKFTTDFDTIQQVIREYEYGKN